MEVSQYGTGRFNQYTCMEQNAHLIRNFLKFYVKALIDTIKNKIVMLQI